MLEAFTPLNIIGSWRSTGMWPVKKQRVLESLNMDCSKDTVLESKYAKFIAAQNPLPLEEIEEQGLRRLKNNGLDVHGFRMYSIAYRDLVKPTPIKGRSPNKVVVKLGAKRLLTHADCIAEEERRAELTRESIETSLMKFEDSCSKKREKEHRKRKTNVEKG
ncbi:hypothetical protein AM588_10001589 [Phytophthora nicotianae]|uniref:Uncharacterized protein n=1 Tax=Phytophthora nicotianae TaxID=4792 RepID=A0A0W8CQ29_PHYNI|nr:hypothetical protein AM588_10001589 [Phytophthora nicotianae]